MLIVVKVGILFRRSARLLTTRVTPRLSMQHHIDQVVQDKTGILDSVDADRDVVLEKHIFKTLRDPKSADPTEFL